MMSSKATQTSVADTDTSTQLIAANRHRNGLLITNTSDQILYILLGAGTATATTAHSWQLAASGGQVDLGAWRGAVQGIWAADSTGAANITSLE